MAVTWDDLFRKGEFASREPSWGVRRFAAFLRGRGAKRVLDIGCGAGRNLIFLAREGFEVHGLDSSKEALRICRERLAAEGLRAALVEADMGAIPYPDGFFDAAIAIAALYHNTLEGIRRAIAEIHRVLREGGYALLEFKSKRSFRYGEGREIEPDTFIHTTGEDAGIPHHYSDRGEIEGLLVDFSVLEIDHMERVFGEGNRSARWEVWVERP